MAVAILVRQPKEGLPDIEGVWQLASGGGPRRTQHLPESWSWSLADTMSLPVPCQEERQLFPKHPAACPALGRAGPLSGSDMFGFNYIEDPKCQHN